jgi:hypothetical protein
MDKFRMAGTADMTPAMIVLTVLAAATIFVSARIRESPVKDQAPPGGI